MKRIITLLLIILVSNPVIGQITKQNRQEFENLTNSKIFKPIKTHQNRLKDFQTPDFKFNSNKNIYAKSRKADKKTLDSVVSQEWDNDFNLWRNGLKEDFIYDGENITTRFLSYWNYSASSWDRYDKEEYTFDANGNVLSKITSFQFNPTVWDFGSKTEYTYILNNDGVYKLTQEKYSVWDSNVGQWVNSNMYELTYDTNETLVTLKVDSDWDLGSKQWINSHQKEFFYINARISSVISSNWIYGTTQWEWKPNSKRDYFWDSPFIELLYYWDTDENDWINESKFELEYFNPPGGKPLIAITKETGFNWDMSMDQWKPDYKDEYEYDNNTNRTLGSYFEWNETVRVWVEYGNDEFVFDLTYDFQDDLIVPYNYAEDVDDDTVFLFNNMVIGYLYFDYVNQAWEDDTKTLFFYSNYTNQLSVDKNILLNAISVYPNPTADVLVIDSNRPLTKVEMYSVLGKKVMDINSGFKSIPMHTISDGLYIVKIQSENKVVFKKIIKK